MKVWLVRPRLRAVAIRIGIVGAAFVAVSIVQAVLVPGASGVLASLAAFLLALATALAILTRRARGMAPRALPSWQPMQHMPAELVADAGLWAHGAWLRDHSGREHWIRCRRALAHRFVERALASDGVRCLEWTLSDAPLRPLLTWSATLAVPWVLRRAVLVPWALALAILAVIPTTLSYPLLALLLGAVTIGAGSTLRIEFGSDGIRVLGLLVRRWIRFTQIRRVRSRPAGVVLCTLDGDVVIPVPGRCERRALARELRRRVIRAKRDVRAIEVLHTLPPRRTSGYRVASLPTDALLDVALSPDHAPTDRIAAAAELDSSDARPAAGEAWAALDACVEPTTRHAVRRHART